MKKLKFKPIDDTPYWERDFKDNFEQNNEKKTRLVQLFNIRDDPYELSDVSDDHEELVRLGLSLLSFHNESAVAPQWPKIDPNSKPDLRTDEYKGFWWPWRSTPEMEGDAE